MSLLQVVASAAADAASRMAIFATINSVSAVVIAVLQLSATGFLLTRLKLPAALAASALFTAGLMAAIAAHPSPAPVGGGEVLRKVGIQCSSAELEIPNPMTGTPGLALQLGKAAAVLMTRSSGMLAVLLRAQYLLLQWASLAMVLCQSAQCMQVINYVLTRPAREALFTVVSDAEMYKAKLCIDTVVVRVGDTVAAGLFQVLEGILSAGERQGLASHACSRVWYARSVHTRKNAHYLRHQPRDAICIYEGLRLSSLV